VSVAFGGAQITIYDMSIKPVAKRVRTLLPYADEKHSDKVADIISMDFSGDGKYLVAQVLEKGTTKFSLLSLSHIHCLHLQYGQPLNKTMVWEWQRSKTIATSEMATFVNCIRFNPQDSTQISTSGPSTFKLWRIQADVLKPYPPFGGVRTSDTNFMVWCALIDARFLYTHLI
jgi:hypothetical protein